MSVVTAAFASEMTKISEVEERKRKGYGSAVLAAAPFAAASAAADVPKGWVDKHVEQVINRVPTHAAVSGLRRGLSRGAGRLGAGLATSPVFLSGIQDLRSDDPQRKRRGYAKVIGSGAAFSVLKGGISGGLEDASKGLPAALRKMRGVASAQGVLGTVGAVTTAASVAKATKEPEEKHQKKGVWGRYGMPAAVGAGMGALDGAAEKGIEVGRHVKPRHLLGAAGGRAAAGALGATLLTGLVKRFEGKPGYRLEPSKTDPTKRRWQKVASAQPPGMYQEVRSWAGERNDVEVYTFLKQINEGDIGERTQSRRAALYALQDELASRGRSVPTTPLRKELEATRDRVVAPGAADRAILATAAFAPSAVAVALQQMDVTDKERTLDDALDRVFVKNRIERVEGDYAAWRDRGEAIVSAPPKGKAQPGLVAHELGHATAGRLRRATIAHPMTSVARLAGALASVVLPLAVVATAGDGQYATREELERKARLLSAVGTASAVLQSPAIAEEAMASYKAVRLLRQAGDSHAVSRVLRQAGPGFATYLAPVALPFIAATQLRRHARNNSERERS